MSRTCLPCVAINTAGQQPAAKKIQRLSGGGVDRLMLSSLMVMVPLLIGFPGYHAKRRTAGYKAMSVPQPRGVDAANRHAASHEFLPYHAKERKVTSGEVRRAAKDATESRF